MVDVELHLGHVVVAGACLPATCASCWNDLTSHLNGVFANSIVAQVFRQLNSVSVPKMVSVPKNDEEDAKRGNQ